MQEDLCGPGRTYNEAKGACEISECIEPATYAAISSGVSLSPPAGAVMAGITYAACKGFRSLETSAPASGQAEPSQQTQERFDSTPRVPVDDHRYDFDTEPVVKDEHDLWSTEEDLVDVDLEHDFTTDFDFSAGHDSLYTDSSKNSMKSWA